MKTPNRTVPTAATASACQAALTDCTIAGASISRARPAASNTEPARSKLRADPDCDARDASGNKGSSRSASKAIGARNQNTPAQPSTATLAPPINGATTPAAAAVPAYAPNAQVRRLSS